MKYTKYKGEPIIKFNPDSLLLSGYVSVNPKTDTNEFASPLLLKNGKPLPRAGTMFTVGTERVFYYTDKELSSVYRNPTRPDYDLSIATVEGFEVGLFTGNFFAKDGKLFSVEVNHISPLNDNGELFKYTSQINWVGVDLDYVSQTQGELPKGYIINSSGLISYDFDSMPKTDLTKETEETPKKKNNYWWIIGLIILFLSRK